MAKRNSNKKNKDQSSSTNKKKSKDFAVTKAKRPLQTKAIKKLKKMKRKSIDYIFNSCTGNTTEVKKKNKNKVKVVISNKNNNNGKKKKNIKLVGGSNSCGIGNKVKKKGLNKRKKKSFILNVPRSSGPIPWISGAATRGDYNKQRKRSNSDRNNIHIEKKNKNLPTWDMDAKSMEQFDNELLEFAKFVQLSKNEKKARDYVVNRIREIAQQCLTNPNKKPNHHIRFGSNRKNSQQDQEQQNQVDLQIFGSFATPEVSTFTSDIDIALWNVVPVPLEKQRQQHQSPCSTRKTNDDCPTSSLDLDVIKKKSKVEKWKGLLDEFEKRMMQDEDEGNIAVRDQLDDGVVSSKRKVIELLDDDDDGDDTITNYNTSKKNSREGHKDSKIDVDASFFIDLTTDECKNGNKNPVIIDDDDLTDDDEEENETSRKNLFFTPSNIKNQYNDQMRFSGVPLFQNNDVQQQQQQAPNDEEDKDVYVNAEEDTDNSKTTGGITTDLMHRQTSRYGGAKVSSSSSSASVSGSSSTSSSINGDEDGIFGIDYFQDDNDKSSTVLVNRGDYNDNINNDESSVESMNVHVSFEPTTTQTSKIKPAYGPTGRTRILVIDALVKLARQLRKKKFEKSLEVIKRARVPIIKMTTHLGFETDIALGGHIGTDTSAYASTQASKYKSFSAVTLVLKIILGQQDLDKPFTGGLGSFKLYVLVAQHLERHIKIGGSDSSPGEVLLSFFFRYGKVNNFSYPVHPKARTAIGQHTTFQDADLSSVFRIDDCISLFRQCFVCLRNTIMHVDPHRPKNDLSSSFLADVIDVGELNHERKLCIKKASLVNTYADVGCNENKKSTFHPGGSFSTNNNMGKQDDNGRQQQKEHQSKEKEETRSLPPTMNRFDGSSNSSNDSDYEEAEKLIAGYGLKSEDIMMKNTTNTYLRERYSTLNRKKKSSTAQTHMDHYLGKEIQLKTTKKRKRRKTR